MPFSQHISLVEKRATFVNYISLQMLPRRSASINGPDSPVVLHIYPSVIKTMVIIYHKITWLSMYLGKVCEIFSRLFICNKIQYFLFLWHYPQSAFLCCNKRRCAICKTKHFLKVFFCQAGDAMLQHII